MSALRRLQLFSRDCGYTVTEMLVVMTILGVVMAGITGLFVAGSKAEIDMNQRFQAQLTARLALEKLRREAHCASGVSGASGWTSSVTLTLPSYCKTGSGAFTWCTASLGTNRYGLFRQPGTSCDSTGVKWADHLTSANVFSYTGQSTTSLAKLNVDFPVDIDPGLKQGAYRLQDGLALRNTTRT